jgi:hypothetical protein
MDSKSSEDRDKELNKNNNNKLNIINEKLDTIKSNFMLSLIKNTYTSRFIIQLLKNYYCTPFKSSILYPILESLSCNR